MRVSLSARGLGEGLSFIALRYEKKEEAPKEQYQLMETADYIYRVFITNMEEEIALLVCHYDQRAGAENLIKEANNVTKHPTTQWIIQQLREAFPFDSASRFLIFDRDAKYGLEVPGRCSLLEHPTYSDFFRTPLAEWHGGALGRKLPPRPAGPHHRIQ